MALIVNYSNGKVESVTKDDLYPDLNRGSVTPEAREAWLIATRDQCASDGSGGLIRKDQLFPATKTEADGLLRVGLAVLAPREKPELPEKAEPQEEKVEPQKPSEAKVGPRAGKNKRK